MGVAIAPDIFVFKLISVTVLAVTTALTLDYPKEWLKFHFISQDIFVRLFAPPL
jgi:hypothetical protein